MSVTILEFAKSFISGRLSADLFAEAYMELWKIERDRNILQNDPALLNECLSSIFCIADLYNPSNSKEPYEFNEEQLKHEVFNLVEKVSVE